MSPNNHGSRKNKKQKQRRKNNPNPKTNPPVDTAIPNIHPLSNPHILEMVLIFCKSHHLYNKSFSTLRLVCKLWDIEVCKITRPQTQIPLSRILSPYPEGLGWKWNRSHKSIGYQYQSPYPETPEFPNVKVTVTACKVIRDPKVIRWFKVMGGQVKSLQYSSALNCYHQNKFLGNCLQSWCPNLETLHLSEIQCFASLIHIFEGEQAKYRKFEKEGLNCRKLRSLTISVDRKDPFGEFAQCNDRKNYLLLSSRRQDFTMVYRGLEPFTRLIDNLPERNPESGDQIYQLIENHTENLPHNFFEDVIIPKYFNRDKIFPRRLIDWGILGLILRVAPLKKIIIKKLNGKQQCRDLILFLLYQPSQLRSSLEHLEFQDNDGNAVVGRDPTCLKTLSLFKCPLKYFRMDSILALMESMGYFNDLLESCAATLETLEMSVAEHDGSSDFFCSTFEVITTLPNLKRFEHRNIHRLPMEGSGLLRNCPKLERIYLDVGAIQSGNDFGGRALNWFCDGLEEIAELGHPLRELEICGGLSVENVVQLGKGLGNLVKVDLGVGGADELEYLLEWMGGVGWRKLEHFRVVIGGKGGGGNEKLNRMFEKHLNKIKNLKFMELNFETAMVGLSVEAFRNGFGKLEGLTFLKIGHFGILESEKKDIERSVEHIPAVCFSQVQIYSELRVFSRARNEVVSLLYW